MLRRFRPHDLRRVTDLRGVWDFAFLGQQAREDVDPAAIEFDDRMAIPGNFDATPAYSAKRGLAAYRTRAVVGDTTPHRLILDGVHHAATVFVDGEKLRDHLGGFTRFSADFTPQAAGEVEIVVLVDNRIDYDLCPLHLDYFDWYHFGGISRGVELHRLGELTINWLRVVTEDYQQRKLAIYLDIQGTVKPGPTELAITVDGKEILSETVELDNRFARIKREITLTSATLWSPEEPNLHDLHVRLGEDDMRERVGIRQVEVSGRDILINGQAQQLLGFNRHEAHPQMGCGLVDQLIVSDVQQLKDMNCNFVRGSHYPQDVRFLDLCDEAGLCVWNESIGWQHTAEHLNDPRFMELQLQQIDEMIVSSWNRPSVIMWGIINESHSNDPDCRKGYETLLGRIRETDPSRPVTYACNKWKDDLCMDLADIISVNCYPGWYGTEMEGIPEFLDQVEQRFGDEGMDDKPMIISEIGAGALYGWRDDHETRWTEQYQAKLLETVIRHMFHDRDRYCGLAIWLFGDARTSHQVGKAIGRPRAFNNKGVVDEYRRPKQAYRKVQELFGELRNR